MLNTKKTKNLQNRIKSVHLSIKILLVAVVLGLVAAALPDSFFKWLILGLLLISYPFIVVYFVVVGITSITKRVRQETKEFKQYYNEFELTDISLKKGIVSLTIIQNKK
jgi:Ca2+/Na+ antiporter